MHDECIPIPTEDTTAYGFRFLPVIELIPGLQYTPVWKDAPWAPVVLETSKTGLWTWRVVRCPYCSKTHEHGGQRGGEPRAYLGGRVAHCHPDEDTIDSTWGSPEYRLIGIEGAITREGLDRYFPMYWKTGSQVEPRISLNTPEVRDAVWAKSRGYCWYCGIELLPFSTFTIDHVVALANGGSNNLENLVPCCKTCNSRKRDYPLELFRIRHFPIRQFWFETGEAQVTV